MSLGVCLFLVMSVVLGECLSVSFSFWAEIEADNVEGGHLSHVFL